MKGTPFVSEDEKIQRKVDKINKKPWEQEVRDEKGRKRFHGAFTGGFSAGYFNSVGSKEGWAPKTFMSTRTGDNKTIQRQSIFDIMDEEDIKDQIGTHVISTKDNFKEYSSEITKGQSFSHVIPGELPKDLYLDFNNSIGNKLMIEAGYGKYQKDNKKMYGCSFENKEIDNEDNKYYTKALEFKDDCYGIGYYPTADEIFNKKKMEEKETTKNQISMGKFADDVDLSFYNPKDLSEYNFEEVNDDDRKLSKNNKDKNDNTNRANHGSNLPKFIKSDSKLQISFIENYNLPKLPKDYDPFKKVKEKEKGNYSNSYLANKINNSTSSSYENKGRLDPNKRANIIGEKSDKQSVLNSKFTSSNLVQINDEFNNKMDIDFQNNTNVLIELRNNSIEERKQNMINPFNYKIPIPFIDDIAKISRFGKFIAEKEGLFVSEQYFAKSNLMTGSQLSEERILFQKLYEDEQKMKRAEDALKREINRDKLMFEKSKSCEEQPRKPISVQEKLEKLKNKLTKREKVKWRPDRLVCKRFEIKDPYENVIIDDVEVKNTKKLGDKTFERGGDIIFNNTSGMNAIQKEILNEEIKHKNMINSSSYIKSSNNDKNAEILVNSDVNKSIFEQIFDD